MQENKMGYKPIGPLLLSMSIPMMVSMLVQALYNIVDSIFVAQISEKALTAVSLAFPFQSLMIAVGVGTGVGVNACLSKALGARNPKLANAIAENGLFLALASYVVFAVLGGFGANLFFSLQTTEPVIISHGDTYLWIVSVFGFGLFASCMTEKLLTSTGKTNLTMLTQITGALINLVLDPIMIFGLFGFPRLEVAGAAIATVLGQIGGGLLGLWLNRHCNPEISISLKRVFHPSWPVIRHIYGVGLPSIIMQAIGSIMTFGMNQILIAFSTTATAVFGVYFKLQSFVFMPIFGLNNGLVPIVAYNLGARKPARMMSAWKYGLLYAFVVMVAGTALFLCLPQFFLGLFSASAQMLEIGVPALRTICVSFIPAGFCIICSAFFQATGHGMLSMYNSIIRQLVALLPLAWLFSRTGNIHTIWWAFPLSEGICVLCTIVCFVWVYKRQIKPLYEPVPAS